MKFIQIIEYRTSDIDAVQKVGEDWEQATEGKRTVRRSITTRDRNDSSRFFDIVFFDSYESAMENSNLPETRALAEKFASLLGEAPRFYDLDVVDDRS